MTNTKLGFVNTLLVSLSRELYGPRNCSSFYTCLQKEKEKERKREEDKAGIRYRVNGEEERTSRTNGEDEERVMSNSMRGRFGSPIFGPEHFQAHPLRGLFRLGRRRASNCPCKFQF